MKTNMLSLIGKGVLAFSLSLFLASCGGDKADRLTTNSSEPTWVNDVRAAKDYAKTPVVGVGSAKLLDGNVNYATNQAAMQARIIIAQTINTKIEQAIKQMEQSDDLKISSNSLQAAKQKVEATLTKSEIIVRWTDKQTNPPTLYVLVGMDKDAYDQALKAGTQMFNIDEDKARKLAGIVDDMLQ